MSENVEIKYGTANIVSLSEGKAVALKTKDKSLNNNITVNWPETPVPPGPTIVPWSSGTDAQIAEIVAALDAGTITAAETGWKVGDTRNVSLGSFATYSGSTSSTATQAAQTAQLVIMNIGGKTFRGNGTSLDGTACHFVVGFKNCVCTSYWASSNNTYSSSLIKTVENNVYNALPSAIKPIFKKFDVVTGTSNSANATTQQYFTSPAEKEIFGGSSRSYSYTAEFNALSQFTWYATAANRVKQYSGSSKAWWERSPRYDISSSACLVISDGTANSVNVSYDVYGVAPFGCI